MITSHEVPPATIYVMLCDWCRSEVSCANFGPGPVECESCLNSIEDFSYDW